MVALESRAGLAGQQAAMVNFRGAGAVLVVLAPRAVFTSEMKVDVDCAEAGFLVTGGDGLDVCYDISSVSRGHITRSLILRGHVGTVRKTFRVWEIELCTKTCVYVDLTREGGSSRDQASGSSEFAVATHRKFLKY